MSARDTVLDLGRVPPGARLPGGKARGLALLLRAGLTVPQTLVLPGRLLLGGGRLSAAEQRLRRGGLDAPARMAVRRAASLLGDRPLAVRSSGPDEDRATGARAGLYYTELNVPGGEALDAAVRQCVLSLIDHGADPRAGGVLLQPFLEADRSGVLFTRDPVDRSARIVIEATWGLGPSLVGGAVDPDRYVLRRERFEILEQRLGRKQERVVAAGGGGTRVEPTPETLRSSVVLDPADLEQLHRAGRAAARALRGPADVEWCFEDDRLVLLQARPLTGPQQKGRSAPKTARAEVADEYVGLERPAGGLHSRLLADELWHGAVTPMMFATAGKSIEAAMIHEPLAIAGLDARFPGPHLRLHRGRVYVALAPVKAVLELLPPLAVRDELLRLLPPEERERLEHRGRLGSPTRLLAALVRFTADRRAWSPSRAESAFRRFVAGRLIDRRLIGGVAGPPAAQLERLDELVAELKEYLRVAVWGVGWAYVFVPLLKHLCTSWLDDDGRMFARLLADPGGSRTAAYNRDLQALATRWHGLGEAARVRARQRVAHRGLADAGRGWADPHFLAALEHFLGEHGHRALGRDLIFPRLEEDLGLVLDLLDGAVNGGAGGAAADAEDETEAELRRRLRDPLRRKFVDMVRRRALTHQRLREDMRSYADCYLFALRRVLLKIGRELASRDRLARDRDVFFLAPEEIPRLVETRDASLLRQVRARQRQYETYRQSEPPAWLIDGAGRSGAGQSGSAGLLQGFGAAPGTAGGRACVIEGPADLARLRRGEVLVAEACDPAWTAAFGRAAAVATELGGLLSHTAIVARERGLPAVVGVEGLLERVRTGQWLEIDGLAGTVRLGDEETAGRG